MNSANDVAKKLSEKGGRLYLVGGAVRDMVMGIKPKDMDYCVCGLSQKQFEDTYPDANLVGKDFPVYRMEIGGQVCEVSFARSGSKGNKVNFSPDITIEEDLKRRDFTMNSMAVDVLDSANNNFQVIDPTNGKSDIEKGIIRASLGDFVNDPVKAYRAARFAARLGRFSIEPNTLHIIRQTKGNLCTLAPDRVFEEIRKGINTETPSVFFRILKDTNLLGVHYSCLNDLNEIDFSHSLATVDLLSKSKTDETLRFAGMFHHVKPEMIKQMKNTNGIPSKWIDIATQAADCIERSLNFKNNPPEENVNLLEKLAKSKLGLKGMQTLMKSHQNNTDITTIGNAMLANVASDKLKHLKLSGKELGQRIKEERAKFLQSYDKNDRDF